MFHGPVRVPSDAAPGQAVLRVSLRLDSQMRGRVLPTDMLVLLAR